MDALDDQPLDGSGLSLPAGASDLLVEASELLDDVASRWFDEESAHALRRALLHVDDSGIDPTSRAHPPSLSPEAMAGGVCWAVGKANGCFRPTGPLGVTRIAEALALGRLLSGHGQRIRAALMGPDVGDLPTGRRRPDGTPDLLPLGDVDVLVSSTRVELIRVRDRALHEQEMALYRGR